MGLAEVAVGFFALIIAILALQLQRAEIAKNSKINALTHMSSMLQAKINFHSKIIDNMKDRKENWTGHADKINKEMRPMKERIDSDLVDIISKYENMPDPSTIKNILFNHNDDS